MLEQFKSFILEEDLCRPSEKVLLAVSGGIDSVAMLELFREAGYDVGIAHCNFRLRGSESEEDENFVRKLAEKYGLEYHVRDFDTGKTAAEDGISIQMAARNLRYSWFETLRKEHQYDRIATAHNQDDILETFFINLSRGTGIRGLTGIPIRTGKVIRPLLFASRKNIHAYIRKKSLDYREDSSNASDKYLRNMIRHQLIPLMEEKNPSFRQSMAETIEKLKETGILYKREIENMKNQVIRSEAGNTIVDLMKLLRMQPLKTLLFEILAEYNFSSPVMNDVIHALQGTPGKQFFSSTHRLVKDREQLIITPVEESDPKRYYIDMNQESIQDPVHLEWVVVDRTENFNIPNDPKIASLDLDLLEFPLILRHWQQGDYFRPFGMKGMKKLSDFLIDKKVPLPDKEKIWLLCTGQKIIWVVGYRIDDRFRITGNTKQILMIRYQKQG